MKKILLLLTVLMTLQLHAQQIRVKNDDLKELASRMTGIFSNAEQVVKNKDAGSVVLHMKPIWLNRKDGFWFYAEEADAGNLNTPSKQTIYQVFRQDNHTLTAKTYELNNPADYVGAWNDENKLYQLTEEGLTEKPGCAILFHKNNEGDYTGSTSGKECLVSLQGAAYTTSEITIYNDRVLSWSRGWDSTGKQVWGGSQGYVFIKSKD